MASTSKKEWFYLALGRRRGPVTKEDIQEMISKQEIYVDSTKVWREGMDGWVMLVNSKDFASHIKKLRSSAAREEMRLRQAAAEAAGVDERILCNGLSRALFNVFFFVGWLVPLALGVVVLTELQVFQFLPSHLVKAHSWIPLLPLALSVIVLWRVASSRMKNAGYSRAHGLTLFVPIWNLWTLLICLCAPRNFGRKRKPDKGAVIYFLSLFFIISMVLVGLIPGVKAHQFSPLEINEGVTEYYQQMTGFRDRYNKRAAQTESPEEKRLRKQQEEEAKMKRRAEAQQKKRGL